jgi:hypothetical protein
MSIQDAVGQYLAASEACDIDSLMLTLAPDAELRSPISSRMSFRGHEDLRILTSAVYGSLRGLRWRERVDGERISFVSGSAHVGPFRLDDAMIFELGEDGLITRVRPHLRPWLGLTALAVTLAPRIARHPSSIMRSLSRPH